MARVLGNPGALMMPRAISRTRAAPLRVVSLLAKHQYSTRVSRLKQHGLQVYDFSARTLSESSYGEDVAALQAYLGREGYLNPVDGVTGYFGAVTREALQNWQRDHGLQASGAFDSGARWAYLHKQEGQLQQARAVGQRQAAVTAAAAAPPTPAAALGTLRAWSPASLGGALLLAAALLASGLPGRLVRLAQLALPWVRAGAARRQQQRHAAAPRRHRHALPEAAAPASAALPLARLQPEAAAPAAQPARRRPAAAAEAPPARSGPDRRLSDDELQRQIAFLKGEAPTKKPVQRPAPKRLSPGQPAAGGDPFVASRYGTYYGGRQVIENLRESLDRNDGPGLGPGGSGAAARRTQAIGYSMRPQESRRAPRRPTPQAPRAASPQLAPRQPAFSAAPAAEPGASFRDVQAAAPSQLPSQVAVAPRPAQPAALLAGTELEAAPEAPSSRPVPVQRPSRLAPPQPAAAARQPASPPRPVAVVRPNAPGQRRSISELLPGGAVQQQQRGAAAPADAAAAKPGAQPVKVVRPDRMVGSVGSVASSMDDERYY